MKNLKIATKTNGTHRRRTTFAVCAWAAWAAWAATAAVAEDKAAAPPATVGRARQPFVYQNPIRSEAIDGGIRDPHLINWDGKYYLTGTSHPFTRGARVGVKLWSSDDLKNWKSEGLLIDSSKLPEDVWYRDTFWANEIHIAKGKFWLTFNAANMSAEHKAQHSCGLAVADKITGPYTVLTTRKSLLDGKHVHQTSHPTQP